MYVHIRHCLPNSVNNVHVGLAGIIWMNATLHTYLSGSSIPCFDTAPSNFFSANIIGSSPKVFAEFAFGKRAELALEVTDVSVINITIDNVTHRVAINLLSKFVSTLCNIRKILTSALKQFGNFLNGDCFFRLAARYDVLNFFRDSVR